MSKEIQISYSGKVKLKSFINHINELHERNPELCETVIINLVAQFYQYNPELCIKFMNDYRMMFQQLFSQSMAPLKFNRIAIEPTVYIDKWLQLEEMKKEQNKSRNKLNILLSLNGPGARGKTAMPQFQRETIYLIRIEDFIDNPEMLHELDKIKKADPDSGLIITTNIDARFIERLFTNPDPEFGFLYN